MTTSSGPRGGTRLSTLLAELSVVFSTGIAVISIVGVSRQVIIAVAVPLILFAITIVLALRRLYSVTTVSTTIAIGGSPGVGKTVYINILCSQLMEGGSSYLSFVPETQTAQHVYRTMRSMRRGEWPAQTSSDKINRYRGKIAFNNRSLLSVLVNGRLEFEVEFGDAAGETWHELASEADAERAAEQSKQIEDSQLRLIESTFFAYVGESDSLFYFIDMENFVIADPEKVTEAVDDLLSTIQLLRTIEGGGPLAPLEKPIAVILSKADMLSTNKLHEIKKIISDISRPPTGEGAQFDASLRELDRLNTVLQRYSRSYRLFLVSSLAEDRTTREHQYSRTSDRIDWESYSEFRTAIPVEWVFYRLWRLRRSKRRGI